MHVIYLVSFHTEVMLTLIAVQKRSSNTLRAACGVARSDCSIMRTPEGGKIRQVRASLIACSCWSDSSFYYTDSPTRGSLSTNAPMWSGCVGIVKSGSQAIAWRSPTCANTRQFRLMNGCAQHADEPGCHSSPRSPRARDGQHVLGVRPVCIC